jgi:signal peptidase I
LVADQPGLPSGATIAKMDSMTTDQTSEPTQSATSSPARQAWKENAQILLIAVILAILIRIFVAEPRFIPSDSMVPTLQIGDRIVVEKLSYYARSPHPGDIIVFDPPPLLQQQGYDKDQAFIKRIIAQAGQTVQVQNGKVYVNHVPLTEPYIQAPPEYIWGPVQVPADHYVVMGDNRNNSNDSHIWGFLPRQNIIGRAWFRFYPFGRTGFLKLQVMQ